MSSSGPVIGFLLFPRLTQLDLTGAYEVLARVPGAETHLLWKDLSPIASDTGLRILPTTSFNDCSPLDVLCVPGGPGVNAMLEDSEVLDFLRRAGENARYVTSVCTGALVLGAAGLLRGYRAATHWASMELLSDFGAQPEPVRVCRDRNRITGGGVTAGIDFGLALAAELSGQRTAEMIQLYMEYTPDPPFAAGSPVTAAPDLVAEYRRVASPMMKERREAMTRAVARLGPAPD
jgi:cyclohexyl-isocyanide hydratase